MSTPDVVITSDGLRHHWQGHRRVTRRVIEAFPEEAFFAFTIGGMRPFASLTMEMIGMAVPVLRGAISGDWTYAKTVQPTTRAEVLSLWDQTTEEINRLWPQIPAHRFQGVDKAFGQWEQSNISTILYAIDNEIHHRGQGYVYLRALGIEPPPFYERA